MLLSLVLACVPVSQQEEDLGPVDSDGDGLMDDEEAELGTDPASEDSDGDGVADPDELDAGTDPTFEPSQPYEEGEYLIGMCSAHPDEEAAGPTASGGAYGKGYALDDVGLNIEGFDSYEQEIGTWAFCGSYTLVTLSASWCAPCQAMAAELVDVQDSVRNDYPNFQAIEILIQDTRGDLPNTRDLVDWRDTFGLEGIPVIAASEENADVVNGYEYDGYIPSTTLLGPDMTVIWSESSEGGYLDKARPIKDAIEAYEAQ